MVAAMSMAGARTVTRTSVREILTRTSGYLAGVTSHSLQPYRGCSYGRALCGVACYVQHSTWITQGRPWGSFLEARTDAADAYRRSHTRERRYARGARGEFSIFLSSATDPFVPEERRLGVTRSVLAALADDPPDALVVQTHSPDVARERELLRALSSRCRLRVHVSIESDRDRLPGLPPPAASVERRLAALSTLRDAGIFSVATLSPLFPIADPGAFFRRLDACADAVVVDHFIGGDGSKDGARTRRTALPAALEAVRPGASQLAYRDEVVAQARALLPGRVGVGRDGFAGRYA
jgi:DNA repair photolyase